MVAYYNEVPMVRWEIRHRYAGLTIVGSTEENIQGEYFKSV